ncbi:MAG: methyltransferase domain-containing protein [Proteobacteria bacterium]|nr:methyltransferase domain-containing protein [Pseudomonadota bacterium]HQR04468.1 methyltransferase domain-containing protein [Rhodocyclaceae bacterium]
MENKDIQRRLAAAIEAHAAQDWARAEAGYRAILADSPGEEDASHYLGVLLAQRGQMDAGLDLIMPVIEAHPSALRLNDLGNLLHAAGRHAAAADAFLIALELTPADPDLWNNLGAALNAAQKPVEAETALRQALRLAPGSGVAYGNLAQALQAQGREGDAALAASEGCIHAAPGEVSAEILGVAYSMLGRIEEAARTYRQWLEREPENPKARHFLAACTGQDVPPRAGDAYVEQFFDSYADTFDDKLQGRLDYQGPRLVAAALERIVPAGAMLRVLDGGCGTGLCGPVLRPHASELTGVDLSAKMLAQAARRGTYHHLRKAELTAYLASCHQAFDLAVFADTLIYFGDLSALFAALACALTPGGWVVATLETTTQPNYQLKPSGRYGHAADHVEELLARNGFQLIDQSGCVLRRELMQPVPGRIYTARRGG